MSTVLRCIQEIHQRNLQLINETRDQTKCCNFKSENMEKKANI